MRKSYISFFIIISLWSYAGTEDAVKEFPLIGKDRFIKYDKFLRMNESADTELYDIADGLLDRAFFEKTSHMEQSRVKATFIQLFTRRFGLYAWLKDRAALAAMAHTLYETILIDREIKKNLKRVKSTLSVSACRVIVELYDDE